MVERDINFEDPVIQLKYDEALDRMGPQGRVERMFSLYAQGYQMVEFSVKAEFPKLSERELRKRIAQRMYLSDDHTQQLIEQVKV